MCVRQWFKKDDILGFRRTFVDLAGIDLIQQLCTRRFHYHCHGSTADHGLTMAAQQGEIGSDICCLTDL